jgi:hypothetical protein
MSTEYDKLKHSKRIHAKETAVKKQTKIAKAFGIEVKEPHKFAKHHALDCGHPGCIMCGNPRKIWKQDTIQEKRFKQPELYLD